MGYVYIAELGRNLDLGLEFGAVQSKVLQSLKDRSDDCSQQSLLLLCQIFLQLWAGKARLWVRNSESEACMTIYFFMSVYVSLLGSGQGLLQLPSCNWNCYNFEPSCYFKSIITENFRVYFKSSICS